MIYSYQYVPQVLFKRYILILLQLAKMLRYLELPQIYPDITFGTFMVSWFITRHVLFMIAIRSTIFDMPRVTNYGWDPSRGYYLTKGSHSMFIICLLALEVSAPYTSDRWENNILQVIQIIWFGMICRVAWRVISGESASDVRSDEEGCERLSFPPVVFCSQISHRENDDTDDIGKEE